MNEAAVKALVDEQAEDDGLWFHAETAAEAYVQQALRRLHAVIEGKSHMPHEQVTVSVLVDVDKGIADMVTYLNTIPGVRTLTSCQGTIGEGGPQPYQAQVMATWPAEAFERLMAEFDVTPLGENWGYLHPRGQGENKRLKDGLTEIFHFADTHCEGTGEPEFSWFGWIASRASAALQRIPKPL